MMTIRRGNDRGHFDHGWLDTYHSFSFADYHDPRFMGFRSLRVINEDRVRPGQGFGEHPHRDMEILTYVLSGSLEHRDNLGNGSIIQPGEVQYMSAGTGILHSEFNPSKTDSVHLMQIWIRPNRKGTLPRYEQRKFPSLSAAGSLTLLASADGRGGSIEIQQDAELHAATLRAGQGARHRLAAGRGAWVQVLRGSTTLNGESLQAGDGAMVVDQSDVELLAASDAEILLFDLN
ncbi:MAG TPA: pirin family protein [Phycisphaerae bacterium]|nr:pirin family protein [Phycisphaerae bacterium]